MIKIRKSADRGHSNNDWLMSAHTFSFAAYHSPEFSGFSTLRVINEDIIQPGTGFGMHAHQHMEIMTYVIDGVLAHEDSLGNGSQIIPGEIQRMTAGYGVRHSEFNPSPDKPLHLLQIWIRPSTMDLAPSYEQKRISKVKNEWILIGAEKGEEQVVTIHQDVKVFVAYLTQGSVLNYAFNSGRCGWVQLIKGEIQLNQAILSAGDGAAVVEESTFQITCNEAAELLFFDLVG